MSKRIPHDLSQILTRCMGTGWSAQVVEFSHGSGMGEQLVLYHKGREIHRFDITVTNTLAGSDFRFRRMHVNPPEAEE